MTVIVEAVWARVIEARLVVPSEAEASGSSSIGCLGTASSSSARSGAGRCSATLTTSRLIRSIEVWPVLNRQRQSSRVPHDVSVGE